VLGRGAIGIERQRRDIPQRRVNKLVGDGLRRLRGRRLGEQRLAVSSDDVLVTKRADGSLVIAAWNLTGVGEKGTSKQIELQFKNSGSNTVYVDRVDADHGDIHKTYQEMGSPRYPTVAQIEILRSAAKLPAAQIQHLSGGSLPLTIPPQGLVVIESEPAR